MRKEKKSFVMSLDWYDDIKDLDDHEKGWILDSIYEYQVNGLVPVTDERHLNSMFRTMRKYFDYNSAKYEEQTIQNSLNQQKRWLKEKGDKAGVAAIEEKSRFLKTHSVEEYRNVYERIQPYTDNDIDSDNDNDIDYGSDSDTDSETDIDIEIDSDSESDSEGVQRERKEISLEELQAYCDSHGYHFDCKKMYRAKKPPLYEDELVSQCDFWESLLG